MGQHPIVSRLMRGIFNKRHPQQILFPKWDLQKVLLTVKSWGHNEDLNLKQLTFKLLFILSVVCSKRASTISLLSIESTVCQISDLNIRLLPVGVEKHSRPEFQQKPIILEKYVEDPVLDPVTLFKCYIDRTENIRTSNSLFIDFNHPHTKVSTRMLSSWMSKVIMSSGQTGSSARSASVSKLFNSGLSLDKILQAGDWSRASTFLTHYYKPDVNVSAVILNVSS